MPVANDTVSERTWGTVREDYSPYGTAWEFFPHDHARSKAYRWNEDGLARFCDRHPMICFALALWNGRDPILNERLFGLSGKEGNHGEDVKEYYLFGFDADHYFDVFVEYANARPEDLLIRIQAMNRGPEAAQLTVLPTLQ